MTVSAFLWVQMDEKMELFICWLSRLMPWIGFAVGKCVLRSFPDLLRFLASYELNRLLN